MNVCAERSNRRTARRATRRMEIIVMTTYNLSAMVTVSAYTTVEADTLEEAIAISRDRRAEIGGNGTGNHPGESWIIEDADGVPEAICEA